MPAEMIITWLIFVPATFVFVSHKIIGCKTVGQSVTVAFRNIGRAILFIPYERATHQCPKCRKWFLTKSGSEHCDHNFNTYYNALDGCSPDYLSYGGTSGRKLCPKCRGEMMYNGMRCQECNGKGWIPRF